MSAQESKLIAALDTTEAKAQGKALREVGHYLEESYILNLPPSRAVLRSLEAFAKRSEVSADLKRKARKMVKDYGI